MRLRQVWAGQRVRLRLPEDARGFRAALPGHLAGQMAHEPGLVGVLGAEGRRDYPVHAPAELPAPGLSCAVDSANLVFARLTNTCPNPTSANALAKPA